MKKVLIAVLMVAMIAISNVSAFAATNFAIDFENASLFASKTINFSEALSTQIEIAPQTGFTGNAFKAPITSENSGIWWTTGLALDKTKSSEADFKNLKNVTFKYKSTVAFTSTPFIIQLVWKNKADAAEVTKFEYAFPVVTGAVTTVTVPVPDDVKAKLNTKTGYYLDWVMIGLKSDALDNEFRSGTFIYDDIVFNKLAAATVTTAAVAAGPVTGDSSNFISLLLLLAISGMVGMKILTKKTSHQ